MSLPKALAYPKLKNTAVWSRSTTYAATPTNSGSSYASGTTLDFDLPAGQSNMWLDCSQTYLKFTVTATLSAGSWYAQAHDFINSLTLYSAAGSTQIESIAAYGAFHALIRDICSNADNVGSSDTIMLGASGSRTRSPASVASGSSFTFCMPLISIIGTLTGDSAYLPLHALNSSLKLSIGLNSAAQALGSEAGTTSAAYVITEPSLNLGYIEIAPEAQARINASVNGVYSMNSSTWRTFRQVHPAGQTSNSLLVPGRFTSVKTFLAIQRDSSVLENFLKYSNHERVKNFLTQWQLRVGANYASPKPISCTGTAVDTYMALRRVFSNPTTEGMPTLFKKGEFDADATAAVTSTYNPGSFAIGADLAPFSNITDLMNGLNTVSNTIQMELTYTGTPVAATWDMFLEADNVIEIDRTTGNMTISF